MDGWEAELLVTLLGVLAAEALGELVERAKAWRQRPPRRAKHRKRGRHERRP